MKKLIWSVILLMSLATLVSAQDDTGKNEFTVWGGFSYDSTTLIRGTGRTPDARFGIVAVRYSRRFNNNDTFNLKYTADFIPAAALNYPDISDLPILVSPKGSTKVPKYRPTRYGLGIAPLGLQANFRPRKKYQPFIGGGGGLLYFNQRTPNVVGTRLGFTADIGGGLEIKLKNKRAFIIGYKYYHLSNGNRGLENPGFDNNNLFYLGYTFFSK